MYNKIVNKTIKFLVISLLIITIFIFSLFAFPPSYAISSDDFQIAYKSNTLSYQEFQSDYSILKTTNNYYLAVKTNYDYYETPFYMFIYGVSSGQSTASMHYVILFKSSDYDSFTTYDVTLQYPGGSTGFGVKAQFLSGYDKILDDTYCYKDNTFTSYTSNISEFYCPHFDTLQDGLDAFEQYLNPTPSTSLYEGINIPAGYIARIQVKNGTHFTLNTTMGTDNIAYQDKWVYTSQWYKFNDTSNPETAMATDGITIPWVRSGNTNILGQTNKAKYTINSTVGTYVWVLNPAYMVGQNADLYDTKLNSSIQLTDVVDVLQVRIFALKSTYSWGGIVSSTSTGSGIEYDPTNSQWIDDDGNSVTPNDYGDTNVPTTGTTLIQQFETLLSNLINRIERLLVAPVDYINQLIASANQFFLWLRGLWSWLPAPVIESITAVLIVMCTVGALKLLWR